MHNLSALETGDATVPVAVAHSDGSVLMLVKEPLHGAGVGDESVILRVPTHQSIVLDLDQSGFPERLHSDGYIFVFANYDAVNHRVDIAATDPTGQVRIARGVSVQSLQLNPGELLLGKGPIGNLDLQSLLETASRVVSWAACAATTGSAIVTGGVTLPAAIEACSSLLLSELLRLLPDDYIALDKSSEAFLTVNSGLGCVSKKLLDCASLVLDAARATVETINAAYDLYKDRVDMSRDDLKGGLGAIPTLQVISGNNQVGPVGQLLPSTLRVRAVTVSGAFLTSIVIRFTVSVGNGSVGSSTLTTNTQGEATTSWTLGPAGGVQRVNVSIDGNSSVIASFFAVAIGGTCPSLSGYTLAAAINSSLATSDCTVVRPPSSAIYYYKGYTGMISGGQAVRLTMTSASFTPRIDVGIEPSGNWSLGLDAPAGGTQSSYKALLPTGPFLIRATTAESGSIGAFSFIATVASSDVTNCEDVILASGVQSTQQLTNTDCTAGGGIYDRYFVPLPPGWTMAIDMRSSTIDSYLELFDGGGNLVVFDDDTGGHRDARIAYTSTTNQSYVLHTTTFGRSGTGSYSLSFTLVPPVGGTAQLLTKGMGGSPGAAASAAGVHP